MQCYRASAYRASIVSTWIAVVFDLIDKIRELSVSGDATAKTIEARYETYIRQIEQNNSSGIKSALEFEREILETCRDQLQFIDPQQMIDLTRLREDRHRCAHPSFQRVGIPYQPSAEQARVHIRNAIVHVLAQPPMQGKAALAELMALVSSAYFPSDDQKAFVQLKNSGHKNATEELVRGFIDKLVFGFVTNSDPLFKKVQVFAAINATFELYPALAEDRLRKQLNKAIRDVPDMNFPSAVCLMANVKSAWPVLEQPSKEKVVRYIESGPASDVLSELETLAHIDGLRAAVEKRVANLSFEELTQAIGSHGLRTRAKERAMQFLSQARSWDRANEVFSKAVLPLFSILMPADIESIVRMPKETGADLLGAHGYAIFVNYVRKAAILDEATLNNLLVENGASFLVPQILESGLCR